ncbi:MAG: hypothetical protein RBG13Loki_1745 [Promethearchaeota archaeon CR_4]|nr:MAG: hypothetical protein RBG13Loki_1745 [Candidatus Lokiarchaeota archaeon CR_4]
MGKTFISKMQDNYFQMVTSTSAVELLKKILRESDCVKIKKLSKALNMPETEFNTLITQLSAQFGFKVEGNYVNFTGSDLAGFITDLDAELKQRAYWDFSGGQSRCNISLYPALDTTSKNITNFNQIPDLECECLRELERIARRVDVQTFHGHVEKLFLVNKGLSDLPTSLGQLHFLKDLYLRGNNFADLPPIVTTITSLKCLNLNHNVLKILPETIGALKNLEELVLCHNQLDQLPESIGELRDLHRLWV